MLCTSLSIVGRFLKALLGQACLEHERFVTPENGHVVFEASPATDLIFLRPPRRRTSDVRGLARPSEGVRGRSGAGLGRVLFWDRD